MLENCIVEFYSKTVNFLKINVISYPLLTLCNLHSMMVFTLPNKLDICHLQRKNERWKCPWA
jgi:hypothetical protein